jgi:hypothetical protein
LKNCVTFSVDILDDWAQAFPVFSLSIFDFSSLEKSLFQKVYYEVDLTNVNSDG